MIQSGIKGGEENLNGHCGCHCDDGGHLGALMYGVSTGQCGCSCGSTLVQFNLMDGRNWPL